MQKSMPALKQHHANADREAFFQQITEVAPGLESYVRNRLRTAERNSLILPDLYATDDILDEVFLSVYEHFPDMPQDESALRVRLFQLADEKLDEIIRQESWRNQALSLERVLSDEMKLLDEIPQMTVDADGEIVMVEDLDDAELPPSEPEAMFLEDSFEDEIIHRLELDGALIKSDWAMHQLLARFYAELPAQSRIILDLWTRGRLSVEEIAQVRGVSAEQVREIIVRIQARLARPLARA